MELVETDMNRINWVQVFLQTIAILGPFVIAMLVWGNHIQDQLGQQGALEAALQARVTALEAYEAVQETAYGNLQTSLGKVSEQLATIAARVDDIRTASGSKKGQ